MWPFKKKPKYRFIKEYLPAYGKFWYYTEVRRPLYYAIVSSSSSFNMEEAETAYKNIIKNGKSIKLVIDQTSY